MENLHKRSVEIAFNFASRFVGQANYPTELIELTNELRKEIDEYAKDKAGRAFDAGAIWEFDSNSVTDIESKKKKWIESEFPEPKSEPVIGSNVSADNTEI